jgi:dienelactone hydrolase
MLQSWVQRLLDAGVRPSRITLVGFSRGAGLTALASSGLSSAGINTALMSICEDGEVSDASGLNLGGNLLSIYETSDELG